MNLVFLCIALQRVPFPPWIATGHAALVVLAWLVARANRAGPREIGWAAWLAGFATPSI